MCRAPSIRSTSRLVHAFLLAWGLLSASTAAQQTIEDLAQQLAVERASRQALAEQLAVERAARQALERRLAGLEARLGAEPVDDLEAQLRALIGTEALTPAPPRTVFPSATNPSIGVFVDSVAEAGSFAETLDQDGDRFALRETELDMRLPVAPWADAALVITMEEDAGVIDATVEESYANISLGGLFENDSAATLKLGRFRVPFGHDNVLHTHDLLQVDRPLATQQLVSPEGLAGDGFGLTVPISFRENSEGLGRTSTLYLSLVNGDVLGRGEAPLRLLADDAGLALSSDAPLFVGRWSEFAELGPGSDIELGVSWLKNVGSQAIETSAGTEVETDLTSADVTWRQRDDETGVGSWLLLGEVLRARTDFGRSTGSGFPVGSDSASGWWVTAQRQLDTNTYAGIRVGETDVLGERNEMRAFSPYLSFYPDEFFRVRLQAQHLEIDGDVNDSAQRILLQFTWNFGAHRPHPYWVNR